MQSGKLNHFVTIQALVPVQDETTGVITDTWEEFAEVWANVRPASVREFIAAGAEKSKSVTVVTIRYLPGVKASMRIIDGDHVYNITDDLEDPKSGREWLTLPVTEVRIG